MKEAMVGLTPPGTAAPGAPIATERQTGNQIDIFFVDNNGGLKGLHKGSRDKTQ